MDNLTILPQYKIQNIRISLKHTFIFLVLLTFSFSSKSQTVLLDDNYGIPGDPQNQVGYTMHANDGDIKQNAWEVKGLSGIATSDTVNTDQASPTDLYINTNLTINRTGNLAEGDTAFLEYSFDGGTTYFSEPIGDWSASNRIYFARTFYLSEISQLNIRISLNTVVSNAKWWINGGSMTLNQSPTADSIPTSIAFFTGDSETLPVEMISFNAEGLNNTTVQLRWTTLSESNNDYYQVEKSTDGENFNAIGLISGAGTSTNIINYEYMDDNRWNETTYYRLLQVDYDGNSTYSTTISIQGTKNINITTYPNPATDYIHVELSNHVDRIELHSAKGQLLFQENDITQAKIQINTYHLKPGLYFLNVILAEEVITKKIMIVK